MAQEVYISGATYSAVPGIRLPDSNGNYHEFSDASVTTAVESDVGVGKIFLLADGSIGTGTSQGGGTPSATSHTIYFEFEDSTTTTITAYWDGSFISDAIRATVPTTYDSKTVQEASLDGTAWYVKPSEDWNTLFDGSVTFGQASPYNQIWITSLASLQPVVGEVYRVTVDGTVYNLTAHEDESVVYIGNPMYDWGTDDGSGTPFCLFNGGYGGLQGWSELSATAHTVKIERQVLS